MCSRSATSVRRPTCGRQQDICRLLEAARTLHPPLKAASFEALFGLLAVTGMRVGEAVALERGDVDLDDGVITIREQVAKLERARLVPLHPTQRRRARALRQNASAPVPKAAIEQRSSCRPPAPGSTAAT